MISLIREANTDRDGWPTAAWLLDLSRYVEAIAYGMDHNPMRDRVGSIASAIRAGAEARKTYPAGVSRSTDVERRRALDDATNASDGIILMLSTLTYDAARAAEYSASRGWGADEAVGAIVSVRRGEVCAVHKSCDGTEDDCRTARGTVPEQSYDASIIEALKWARTAEAGEYLVEYEDTGMTDREDPGSRCGYGDDQLDEIGRMLGRRDLRLVADDRGLVAQAVRS